jgi:acyl transferase domain-containing protein/thioesterase domain-containing protein
MLAQINNNGENMSLDGIAVVGISLRFPGADTVPVFWKNLVNKKDCITTLSDEEMRVAGIPESVYNNKNYVRRGGRIKNADLFDASFFGFSPKDAKLLDPQQRLFLKCGWEAIESAGYNVNKLDFPVGVFGGTSFNYYLLNNLISNPEVLSQYFELQTLFSSDKDFLTTRLSYKFNLKGPSFTIQSACSTSLLAIHIACQNLYTYQCDMALAGGVSLAIPWWNGYMVGDADIRSPDGVCRPFDKSANGTLFGEGAGVVVLKRLEDALNDGDMIYAVIKGTAINNDGSVKAGYTAPSVDGQSDVITAAIETAEINPADISYIETHGTGTPMGDPVEIAALSKAFRQYTTNKGYCAIGSVKASIGHLDAAAGVAGFIKTVLALHNKVLPASLNYNEPNPLCEFDSSPFYVVKDTQPWTIRGDSKRIAGVSSLGVGGTNVHAILEEAPARKKSPINRSWHILPLSARSATSLKKGVTAYSDHLNIGNDDSLEDIAFTMQQGRQHFPFRQYVITDSTSDAAKQLSEITTFDHSELSLHNNSKITFMFSGQGSQYLNMGKDLYLSNKTFKTIFDNCCDTLNALMRQDLRKILFSDDTANSAILQKTEITQPLLVSFEIALAKVWEEMGIVPSGLIGHSIGEYSAACLAGVFTIEEALAIVVERGKVMAAQPAGKMLSVSSTPDNLQPLIQSGLEIALVNSPSLCVIAGESAAIDQFQKELESKNIPCRELHTSHAFHSVLMDGAVAPFVNFMKTIRLRPPSIPFISNITGTWIEHSDACDPHYWGKHIRSKVNFTEGISQLIKDDYNVFLEIGPGNTLATFCNNTFSAPDMPWRNEGKKIAVCTSVRHFKAIENDNVHLLSSLATLWKKGLAIEWHRLYQNEKQLRVLLPSYQFDEKRYWIDPAIRLNYGAGISWENNQTIPFSNPESEEHQDTSEISDNSGQSREGVIKNELSQIWKTVLGIDQVDHSVSFFDLGGDSLSAVQMFSKLHQKTGINLQLATLFETPSIATLSAKIIALLPEEYQTSVKEPVVSTKQSTTFEFVVAIKPTGSRIPFFCIHGVGGNVLHYKAFLPYLDKEQPLYGIQCRGLDGIQKPFNSVKEMAQHYVNEILKVQSEGPYLLGGGSMGGLVAFEIALQLTKMGKKIGLLIMLDSACPYVVRKLYKLDPYKYSSSSQSETKITLPKKILHSIWCRVEDLKKYAECEVYRRHNKPIPHDLRYWVIEQKNLSIAATYKPEPYAGAITMFRALHNTENPDPHRGWKSFAQNGFEIFDFECRHDNMVEHTETCKKLGTVLSTFNKSILINP